MAKSKTLEEVKADFFNEQKKTKREDKYELISKLHAEIRELDLEIGNTKINIAIAEVTS